MILQRDLRMELLSTAHMIARAVARGTSDDKEKDQPIANYAPIDSLKKHKKEGSFDSTTLMYAFIGVAAGVLTLCLIIFLVMRFKYKKRRTWTDEDDIALAGGDDNTSSSVTGSSRTAETASGKNEQVVTETRVQESV